MKPNKARSCMFMSIFTVASWVEVEGPERKKKKKKVADLVFLEGGRVQCGRQTALPFGHQVGCRARQLRGWHVGHGRPGDTVRHAGIRDRRVVEWAPVTKANRGKRMHCRTTTLAGLQKVAGKKEEQTTHLVLVRGLLGVIGDWSCFDSHVD